MLNSLVLNKQNGRFSLPSLEIIFALLSTVGLVAIAASLLSLYPISNSVIEPPAMAPWFSTSVNQKSAEQFIILVTLVLLPILNLVSLRLVIATTYRFKKISLLLAPALLILPFVTLFPFVFYNDFGSTMLKLITPNLDSKYITFSTLLTLSFFMIIPLTKKSLLDYLPISHKVWRISFLLLGLSLTLFLTLSFRIITIPTVDYLTHFDHIIAASHLDAVFYSVSQVNGGKTLLFDLPAQYGLYAEMIAPIFSIIGLSLFKFTLIMGLLQIIAISCLMLTILKMIRHKFIIFISLMSLCFMASYSYQQLNYLFDPYYQYLPLRFFFPAVSVFLFSYVIRKISFTTVFLFAIFCGFSILWNIDSGIPVFGAFIAFFVAMLLFPKKQISRITALKMLLVTVLTVTAVILLFFGYLCLKAHALLVFTDYLKYQRIFYLSGFYMLPIARGFAPWQIIASIYILGLTIPFYYWMKGSQSKRNDMLFYLSILGFGLFSYYTGRSHPLTLALCSWPALLIVFIIGDTALRLIKSKKLPYLFAIPVFPIVLLGICLSAALIRNIPILYAIGHERWQKTFENKPNEVSSNIDFIKSKVTNQKEAIILTHVGKSLQSIYYAETGLTSPIKGPGIVELLLADDWHKISEAIMLNCDKPLFIELDDNKQIPALYQFVLTKYKIEDSTTGFAYLRSSC